MRCPNAHGPQNRQHLPYTSRFMSAAGEEGITIRPPLRTALERYFEAHRRPLVLVGGRQWTHHRGTDHIELVTFQVEGMHAQNLAACSAAEVASGVRRDDGTWAGSSSKATAPAFLAHGTSPESGLQIARDGCIQPSPGICGRGIYAFAADGAFEPEDVGPVWDRTISGGYNFGCLWILGRRGTLIKKLPWCEDIPQGATAYAKELFLFTPGRPGRAGRAGETGGRAGRVGGEGGRAVGWGGRGGRAGRRADLHAGPLSWHRPPISPPLAGGSGRRARAGGPQRVWVLASFSVAAFSNSLLSEVCRSWWAPAWEVCRPYFSQAIRYP